MVKKWVFGKCIIMTELKMNKPKIKMAYFRFTEQAFIYIC